MSWYRSGARCSKAIATGTKIRSQFTCHPLVFLYRGLPNPPIPRRAA
jgi:hypothetical protein